MTEKGNHKTKPLLIQSISQILKFSFLIFIFFAFVIIAQHKNFLSYNQPNPCELHLKIHATTQVCKFDKHASLKGGKSLKFF